MRPERPGRLLRERTQHVLHQCRPVPEGLRATSVNRGGGGGVARDRGRLGGCAFARTIKEASATVAERNVYYAAVVQTASRVGVEATDALEETPRAEGGDASVGHEEFLVHHRGDADRGERAAADVRSTRVVRTGTKEGTRDALGGALTMRRGGATVGTSNRLTHNR